MSNVNADATQLLTILKNMRTSISSIETTRSSVKMKYQQLGIGWNDKKYDELGTIVKDCNKALNDILQIKDIGQNSRSGIPVHTHPYQRSPTSRITFFVHQPMHG